MGLWHPHRAKLLCLHRHPATKSIPQPQTCAPSRPGAALLIFEFFFLTEQCLISSSDLSRINQDEAMQVTKNYLLFSCCFHAPNRKRWLGQFREALDTWAELFLWDICTSQKLAQSRAITLLALEQAELSSVSCLPSKTNLCSRWYPHNSADSLKRGRALPFDVETVSPSHRSRCKEHPHTARWTKHLGSLSRAKKGISCSSAASLRGSPAKAAEPTSAAPRV